MNSVVQVCRFLGLALLAIAAVAAERPLGAVAELGDRPVVAFDAGVVLPPGSMVAVYAPGHVQRHPLTDEVIIEDRRLIAKLQIIDGDAGRYQTRTAWIADGVTLVSGYDCIPLPSEAAPNGAPVIKGLAPEKALPGEVVEVRANVIDPDGDPLVFHWSVSAGAGQGGRLVAAVTTGPTVAWVAPALPGTVEIRLMVRDPLGHQAEVTTAVTVAGEADARERTPRAVAALGAGHSLSRLTRAADGAWIAHDASARSLMVLAPGWTSTSALPIASADMPSSVAGVAAFADEVHCIDASVRQVRVFGRDGKSRRWYGGLSRPTDLVLGPDGIAYVADMGLGGVAVFETDGAFRYRLGYEGGAMDGFTKLERIDLGSDGRLACLDVGTRRILIYDRFGRRQVPWSIPGDAKIAPVDLAWHAAGLLVLMADGRVLILDQAGVAGESWAAPASGEWSLSFDQPDGIHVDVDGQTYVTYATDQLIVRRDGQGRINGVRAEAAFSRCGNFRLSGAGFLVGLERRGGVVRIFDSEGFLTRVMTKLGKDILDIAVTPGGTHLFALDRGEYNVKRFDLAQPAQPPMVIGARGENLGQFKDLRKLSVDEAGRLYVLDSSLRRVVIFDAEGRFKVNVNGADKGAAFMDDPLHVVAAPAGDAVYVYEGDRYEVKKYKVDINAGTASFITNAGGRGKAPGQFSDPIALGCDRYGLLYVFDGGRSDVQLIDFRGSNAVVLQTWHFDKVLGQRSVDQATAGPDAVFIAGPSGGGMVYIW